MGLEPDDLYKPLGQAPDQARAAYSLSSSKAEFQKTNWVFSISQILSGAFGLSAALVIGLIALYGDADGGRPKAVAKIEIMKPEEPPPLPAATALAPGTPPGMLAGGAVSAPMNGGEGASGGAFGKAISAQDSERASGVHVTRMGGGEAPGALIIQVNPADDGVSLIPAPDKRVAEKTKYGLLPRVGADGATSREIYARPVIWPPKLRTDAPRLAILVGGIGVSALTTQLAMEKLPNQISFAFAPYGPDVAAQAASARDRGHEIFLQTPMEPFDYPQNNPGPHTLTTRDDDGAADLGWLMGRFTGYVGIVNFLGAKFLSTESAMTPFLREVGQRGLGFVDDGSSPQSLSLTLAAGLSVPAARADIIIDADSKPEAIEAALAKLEAMARAKGWALGFANATPLSIDRVSRFARALESRGLALVPVSAAFGRRNAAAFETKSHVLGAPQ